MPLTEELKFHARRHRALAAREQREDKRQAHERLAVEYERLAAAAEHESVMPPTTEHRQPVRPRIRFVKGVGTR